MPAIRASGAVARNAAGTSRAAPRSGGACQSARPDPGMAGSPPNFTKAAVTARAHPSFAPRENARHPRTTPAEFGVVSERLRSSPCRSQRLQNWPSSREGCPRPCTGGGRPTSSCLAFGAFCPCWRVGSECPCVHPSRAGADLPVGRRRKCLARFLDRAGPTSGYELNVHGPDYPIATRLRRR